jgi:hypothetical protein
MGLLTVNKQKATELLQLHEGSISRVLDSLH